MSYNGFFCFGEEINVYSPGIDWALESWAKSRDIQKTIWHKLPQKKWKKILQKQKKYDEDDDESILEPRERNFRHSLATQILSKDALGESNWE